MRKPFVMRTIVSALIVLGYGFMTFNPFFTSGVGVNAQGAAGMGKYASVNGLKMYYEIHGTGAPLIILHGAYMSIASMGEIVSRLARTRQVIAVELQGHGRTADIDRPLTYEQMADDVAALIKQLNLDKADIFGYSMGGCVALQVAIRHPELVRKIVAASGLTNSGGFYPEVLAGIKLLTPESLADTVWAQDYKRLAPHPENWPTLVKKLVQLDMEVTAWPSASIRAITAPTLVIYGDSDVIRPEHALELFHQLGGGFPGDLTGLPNAQLAILPGTTHLTVITRVDWLQSMITEFLDAPMPKAK